MCGDEHRVWFAMRATYGRNMEVKKKLDEAGLESFVPMRYVVAVDRRGRKTKKFVPVVRDLIFLHTDQTTMFSLKQEIESLRNIYIPSQDGRKRPVIVSDQQMESFIKVTRTFSDGLLFYTPEEVNLTKGVKVRIHGGQFNGLEGTFVKVKGARDKRVVVEVSGVIVVATCSLKCDLIEVLKD
jgi:transcription antitermination factor NusG